MKAYLILKDFKGSQDGLGDGQAFVAGMTAKLSDSLVRALGGPDGGYVKDLETVDREIAQVPVELAEAVREAIDEASDDTPEPLAETRETKVIEPKETKPAKPAAKKK